MRSSAPPAAAVYHSAYVGRRASSQAQKAAASGQVTFSFTGVPTALPLVNRSVRPLPPEPIKGVGGGLVRGAALRVEEAEQAAEVEAELEVAAVVEDAVERQEESREEA